MKQITLLFSLVVLFLNSSAQELCGTEELHSYKMNTDLEYRARYYAMQEEVNSIIENGDANRGGGEEHYVIPVVVHVIHLGEPVGTGSNISDAQIIGAINGLNQRFANENGNGVNIELSFCLATRDPDGCPTNGIVRVNGISLINYEEGGITRGGKSECGNAADDEDVKDLSKWPVTQYYNIWVVHTICGGWAGYAYYPWGGAYDGAVMHRSYMTSSSTTLAHEIGHGFNLPHTFNGDEGGTVCPMDTNCLTNGDNVCDTPPHKVGDCGTTNPCTTEGIWDNSRRNYMSYCGGTNRFTQGQKERMRAAADVFPRLNLRSSLGCTPSAFGTTSVKNNVSCLGACDGSISVTPVCDGNYTYLWSNDETGASVNGLCPGDYSVTITELSGLDYTFDFTILEGVSINPDAMISANNDIEFCDGEYVTLSSLVQGNYSWSTGSTSSFINVFQSGSYTITVTTPTNCTQTSSPFEVIVHPLPDVTFTLPTSISYNGTPFVLNTGLPSGGEYSGPGVSDGMFYPALAQVGTHTVLYSYTDEHGCSGEAQATIIVQSGVNVDEVDNKAFSIYPNPNNGSFTIQFSTREATSLACFDALGKMVFEQNIPSNRESNTFNLTLPNQAEGIYYIKLFGAEQVLVERMLVLKK